MPRGRICGVFCVDGHPYVFSCQPLLVPLVSTVRRSRASRNTTTSRGDIVSTFKHKYIVSTRHATRGGRLTDEPGDTRYLRVPWGVETYDASHAVKDSKRWRLLVRAAADGQEDEITGSTGDVVLFVHGYNNTPKEISWRTEALQTTLAAAGWRGLVVAYDWPSSNSTLNYLEDRSDAAEVAERLVTDCIKLLVDALEDEEHPCTINVHLLGHSTGAYAIMEAFNQAEKRGRLYQADWRVAQVAFIAADVNCASLSADSDWGRAMFKRSVRLTNYANRYDKVLGVSNAKRLGTAPRAGRVGLPENAHSKAVNVDCSTYFAGKDPAKSEFIGTFNHSWHIGDPVFALDLALTFEAAIDRHALPTRAVSDGGLELQPGARPTYQPAWDAKAPSAASRALKHTKRG